MSKGRRWAAVPIWPQPREFGRAWSWLFILIPAGPRREEFKRAKGGGRQDIPHPPIWASDTSCLEHRTNAMVQSGHPGVCRPSLCSSCSAMAFFSIERLPEWPLFVSNLWAEWLFRGALLAASWGVIIEGRGRNNQEMGWVMQGLWCLADSFLPQSAAELDPP